MRDMRMREQRAAVADIGRHPTAGGARIDGHAFSDNAVRPDLEAGGLAGVFPILWRVTDGGKRKDARARTDRGAADDNTMRDQLHAVVKHDVASDVAVRSNLHASAELGAALHQCEGMDKGARLVRIGGGAVQGVAFAAASDAPISASQTRAPSTFAFPSNHHMLRF